MPKFNIIKYNYRHFFRSLNAQYGAPQLLFKFALAVSLLLILSGCAVKPAPFSDEEYAQIIASDRVLWQEQSLPVSAPMCLDEAIARALKANLDYQVNALSAVLAEAELRAGNLDMLPQLMANGGYNWRSNNLVRDSQDIQSGNITPGSSISSSRSNLTADLGLNWSFLDFGISYFNAKQNADRLLIANERRRKAMSLLTLNVSDAYWRALAAQELRARVENSIVEAELALNDSMQILAEQLQDPSETLRFQRNLLENLRLLENVERELAAAQFELASFLGLSPGANLQLLAPDWPGFAPLQVDMEELEILALSNNPDLREQAYNVRIAAQETRKALLGIVPGFNLNYGVNFDNDRFLVNRQWQQASTSVSYNLFNVLNAPAIRRSNAALMELEETQRMALQLAVVSQVHLTHHVYNDSMRQYSRARAIHEVDRRLSEIAQQQLDTQTGNALEMVSREVAYILSSLRLYQAKALVNQSAGQLQQTLGLEPRFGNVEQMALEELIQQVSMNQFEPALGLTNPWSCTVGSVAINSNIAAPLATLGLTENTAGSNRESELTSAPQTFGVVEDGPLIATGQLTVTGVDTQAELSISGVGFSAYGRFEVDAETGEWIYTLDNEVAQPLFEGQIVTETFTVTVRDQHDATTTQSVVIKILGVNDPPTLAPVAAGNIAIAPGSDVLGATSGLMGVLEGMDVDVPDKLTYGIVNGSSRGGVELGGMVFDVSRLNDFGTLYLNSQTGEYRFEPNVAAINALPERSDPVLNFTFTVTDGKSEPVSQPYTIAITLMN